MGEAKNLLNSSIFPEHPQPDTRLASKPMPYGQVTVAVYGPRYPEEHPSSLKEAVQDVLDGIDFVGLVEQRLEERRLKGFSAKLRDL
jgi:hypothetical protein